MLSLIYERKPTGFDDEARRAARYPRDMEKKQLTKAEQRAFEARMKPAGITVVTTKPGTGTFTLLKKREPS